MRTHESPVAARDRTRAHCKQKFKYVARGDGDSWTQVPHLFRARTTPLPPPWEEIFGPLRAGSVDDLVVVGQLGQSIDGRIATITGQSHYINGDAGLTHLHRLRAIVDAVVVGVGTVCADDPQLTVRRVAGPNPVRVVLDPHGRLPQAARLLAEGGRTLAVTAADCPRKLPGIEVVPLPAHRERFAPAAVLAALAKRGLRRVLIEGGPSTLSEFVGAGCLDRLHVIVAPLILGAGRPGFAFGEIDRVEEGLRPPARVYRLDDDVLFDFDLSGARVPIWTARKSRQPAG